MLSVHYAAPWYDENVLKRYAGNRKGAPSKMILLGMRPNKGRRAALVAHGVGPQAEVAPQAQELPLYSQPPLAREAPPPPQPVPSPQKTAEAGHIQYDHRKRLARRKI